MHDIEQCTNELMILSKEEFPAGNVIIFFFPILCMRLVANISALW